MSDPTSKGQIEDVLSSIRKLVTDDDMPTKPPAKNSNKLILTADYRVGTGGAGAQAEKNSAAAVAPGIRPVDAVAADMQASATPEKAPADGVGGPATANPAPAIDMTAEPPHGADLEREVAELEAALMGGKPDTGDSWEPADKGAGASFPKRVAEISDAEVAGEEAGDKAKVVEFTSTNSEAGNAPASDAGENVGKPDVESLLDENDLRALVAEVLREELKGPLGERITRNVRKLVRREIAQALSSLDIE
jgi:hypothetical protein